ncbi:MAG: serine/threonine-protein kinase, partial [Elusimicrobiota bacterium]
MSNINELLKTGIILENHYKVVNLIKKGGMGAVYKAEDIKSNSIYAIKELIPPLGTSLEQEQAKQWFKREAELLKKLKHPNFPKISDNFISNGRYYLVMTYIDGQDLETILEKEGNPGLPEQKVIDWAKQILEFLDYLHNQSPPVIYRDIKPSNIMLNKNNQIVLVDFGIARVIHQNSQTTKTIIGTEGYCPVEQYRGKAEPRSDLYSLGATMHHLLTGMSPIPFKFDPLSTSNPNISSNLENIVMKALNDDLNKRFLSAKQMINALKGVNSLKNTSLEVQSNQSNRIDTQGKNISSYEKSKLMMDKITDDMFRDSGIDTQGKNISSYEKSKLMMDKITDDMFRDSGIDTQGKNISSYE